MMMSDMGSDDERGDSNQLQGEITVESGIDGGADSFEPSGTRSVSQFFPYSGRS